MAAAAAQPSKPAPGTPGTVEPELEGEEEMELVPPPPQPEEPPPLTIADVVVIGRDLRSVHKPGVLLPPYCLKPPLPRPAKPNRCDICDAQHKPDSIADEARGVPPKRRKPRCLHKYQAGCSERLTIIAKPRQRTMDGVLEEFGHRMPPQMCRRMQELVEGDLHFVPAQAYDYFKNMHETSKEMSRMYKCRKRKERKQLFEDRKFQWARDATVVFARGVQKRLLQPGIFSLSGPMLRLSNLILGELCSSMNVRTPARCDRRRKARFLIEMSDKIVSWIDEIVTESRQRVLILDAEGDEEVPDDEKCLDEDIEPAPERVVIPVGDTPAEPADGAPAPGAQPSSASGAHTPPATGTQSPPKA